MDDDHLHGEDDIDAHDDYVIKRKMTAWWST